MAATSTNDLKKGMTLDLSEGLFHVVDFQHVKPGKGPAFVRTTLRNVRTGNVLDKTFRADERVERANVAKLETGLVVQVPLFVNTGDRIKVDTRSAEYLTRA